MTRRFAPFLIAVVWLVGAGCSRRGSSTAAAAATPAMGTAQTPPLAASGIANPPADEVTQRAPPGPALWQCENALPSADFKGQHARDLASVDRLIKGPTARRVWNEGMVGGPHEDRLGLMLPAFVTRERAIAWTDHPAPAGLNLVAARPWSGQRNRWVVIAGGHSEEMDGSDVRLAVIEVTPGANGAEPTIRRLARTTHPLSPRPQWGLLPDDLRPTRCAEGCDDEGPPNGLDDATQLTGLDFAPFDLAPSDRAFGVRTTITEGYSGGFGSFESLSLFRMDGETLTPILDVPSAVEKMLAGDWNPDQSRQHEWFEAELVVTMRPHASGVADLFLHAMGKPGGLAFSWDAERAAYGCASNHARRPSRRG